MMVVPPLLLLFSSIIIYFLLLHPGCRQLDGVWILGSPAVGIQNH